jgi:hypothetical protein
VNHSLRSHTDVVVEALAKGGLAVYRAIGPPDPLHAVPYVVVYAGSGVTDGPAQGIHEDLEFEVQVTAVGTDPEQTEWISDRVFSELVDVPLEPPRGRHWLRPGAPIGHVLTRPIERDVDLGAGAPMFYVVSIYSLPTTPE